MNKITNNNPLELEEKKYTIEEFASAEKGGCFN